MTPEERKQIGMAILAAHKKARGYADFFGWATDRDLEEWGVITSLYESMDKDGLFPYTNVRMRGRGNDPPDCEALSNKDKRVAIEVTELVDGKAIKAYKSGISYEPAEWDKNRFLNLLSDLLKKKDKRFPKLKEPPYNGGYTVVVFTDEPDLPAYEVESHLEGHVFKGIKHITKAIFLVSYDPQVQCCPYFVLDLGS